MLRELRDQHGGPHLGTRFIAGILVLLLAFPITFLVLKAGSALLHAILM
jgi:hypothetical protein